MNPVDWTRVTWQKSTRSNGSGDCVETARLDDSVQAVRDSKDPDGPVLTFATSEWQTFVGGVKAGDFDT
jgi:hypothetical protein